MKNKGITLIALIVTIIVLIILAGVSINLVLGENGIIQKAKLGTKETEKASAKERIEMEVIGSYNDEGKLLAKDIITNIKKNIPEAIVIGEDFPIKVKLDKYSFNIDKDGRVEYERPIPTIENLKITQEDGTPIPEEGVYEETKLKITFNIGVEGGNIQQVSLGTLQNGNVTYITDGTQKEVVFAITFQIDGQVYKEEEKISLEEYYKELIIGETVQIGDFINYSVGSWTQEDIDKLGDLYFGDSVPHNMTKYKFGGFGTNSGLTTSKDKGVGTIPDWRVEFGTPYYNEGWMVLDKYSDGSIAITHASVPEAYYCGAYTTSEPILATTRDWSMYEDCSTNSVNTNYAIKGSAHCMTYNEASKALTIKKDEDNKILPSITSIGVHYWVSGKREEDASYAVVYFNGKIDYTSNLIKGIRPVVTLRADLKVKPNSGDATHTTPETAWNISL